MFFSALHGFNPVGNGSIDANADAFLDALTTLGSVSYQQEVAITNHVLSLKSEGLWTTRVAIYPAIGGIAGMHKFNLVDAADTDEAYRLTFFGGVTHDSNGFTGDGTTGFASTHINLNDDVPQYCLEASFYCGTSGPPGPDDYFMFGAHTSGFGLDAYLNSRIWFQSGQPPWDGSSSAPVGMVYNGVTDLAGLWTASLRFRDEMNLYKNGTLLQTLSTVRGGYFRPLDPSEPRPLTILGISTGETTTTYKAPFNCRYMTVGEGLSPGEVATHAAIIQQLQSDLGRSV